MNPYCILHPFTATGKRHGRWKGERKGRNRQIRFWAATANSPRSFPYLTVPTLGGAFLICGETEPAIMFNFAIFQGTLGALSLCRNLGSRPLFLYWVRSKLRISHFELSFLERACRRHLSVWGVGGNRRGKGRLPHGTAKGEWARHVLMAVVNRQNRTDKKITFS